MAHRTNVVQVSDWIEGRKGGQSAVDPVCGAKLPRDQVKHMLFRADNTLYFCSERCRERYEREQEFLEGANA